MLVISRRFNRRIRIEVEGGPVYVSILGYRSMATGEFNLAVDDGECMKVYGRKAGERVEVGRDSYVTILGHHNDRRHEFNLGIEAPRSVRVLREEIVHRYDAPARGSASSEASCDTHTPTKEG